MMLVGVAVILGIGGLGLLFWSIRNSHFDDMKEANHRAMPDGDHA